MGAKNRNAAFLGMIEDLLQHVRDCANPFVDDIIIGSGSEDMTDDELIEAHEKDLRPVLGILERHSMVCKHRKASLFVRQAVFARFGMGNAEPGPNNLHWEKTQTIVELWSFMGFCNYYSGYVGMYVVTRGLCTRCYNWAR